MNYIFGSSGFAKEVDWLIEDIYCLMGKDYRTDFFVVEDESDLVNLCFRGKKVISEKEFFYKRINNGDNIFIAIGNQAIRRKIYEKIVSKDIRVKFPPLIHPSVIYDKSSEGLSIGNGSILCAGTTLTTNVTVGSFTHININCTVGHDATLESFVTISPMTAISGNVFIKECSFLGTNAIVMPGVNIGPDVTVGAGALVHKDITKKGIYVGSPARKIR